MSTKLHRRQPHRFLRLPKVLEKLGDGKSTFLQAVKEGRANKINPSLRRLVRARGR
jgi:predicted DNA-binding transcriptional regulator AlpA